MVILIIMITKYNSIGNITFNTNIQYSIQSFKRFARNNYISCEYNKIRLLRIQYFIHTIQCYLRIGLIINFIVSISKLHYLKIAVSIKFQSALLSRQCSKIQHCNQTQNNSVHNIRNQFKLFIIFNNNSGSSVVI